MADRNSSADNAAILKQMIASGCKNGCDLGATFVLTEAVRKCAVRPKQRETLRTIWAGSDKPNGASRHRSRRDRNGSALAHALNLGPLALIINLYR